LGGQFLNEIIWEKEGKQKSAKKKGIEDGEKEVHLNAGSCNNRENSSRKNKKTARVTKQEAGLN